MSSNDALMFFFLNILSYFKQLCVMSNFYSFSTKKIFHYFFSQETNDASDRSSHDS